LRTSSAPYGSLTAAESVGAGVELAVVAAAGVCAVALRATREVAPRLVNKHTREVRVFIHQ
jgi:hypothetical protein